MNYATLLIWLLHIPLQLPCGIISTNPCMDCACTVAIAITAGLMVDCCLSKMLFFNCCSSRISYCHAKDSWFVIQKTFPLIFCDIFAINCHAAIGMVEQCHCCHFPSVLFRQPHLCFCSCWSQMIIASLHNFCLGSFPLKKAATMLSLRDTAKEAAESNSLCAAICHDVAAFRQHCCCGWHLLIVDCHFWLLPGYLFLKKGCRNTATVLWHCQSCGQQWFPQCCQLRWCCYLPMCCSWCLLSVGCLSFAVAVRIFFKNGCCNTATAPQHCWGDSISP